MDELHHAGLVGRHRLERGDRVERDVCDGDHRRQPSPAFGLEIDLTAIPIRSEITRYEPIPVMPAIKVDLALVVPDSTTSAEVGRVIRNSAGDLLESLEVFDEFRGQGIPEGARSLAWALTFRHPERTLRDREIQGRTAKILKDLEAALGIKQRTS